jgi:hypothetical protein
MPANALSVCRLSFACCWLCWICQFCCCNALAAACSAAHQFSPGYNCATLQLPTCPHTQLTPADVILCLKAAPFSALLQGAPSPPCSVSASLGNPLCPRGPSLPLPRGWPPASQSSDLCDAAQALTHLTPKPSFNSSQCPISASAMCNHNVQVTCRQIVVCLHLTTPVRQAPQARRAFPPNPKARTVLSNGPRTLLGA